MSSKHSLAGTIALALGKGIIAGAAGTIAITISQMIEMKITKRKPSEAPVEAVKKVLGIAPANEEDKEKMATQVHWTYGIIWGLPRSIMGLAGLNGTPAILTHWAGIWGTEMTMLPAIDVAPPVKEWGGKEIAQDGFHHLVYAIAAGVVYDAIR